MLRSCCPAALLLSALTLLTTVMPSGAETTPADSVRKYRFLGKTARDKGDHKEVIGYYRELLKYRPDYHLGYYYIGRAEMSLGDQEAAKRAFLEAAAVDSTHANTNLLLFQIYSGQNQPDSAWIYLGRLVRSQPDEPKYAHYRRSIADLHRRNGEVAKAIRHYEALAGSKLLDNAERQQLYELLAIMYADEGNTAKALLWRQRLAGGDGPARIESLSKMVDLQIETDDVTGAYETLQELTRLDSAGRYSHFLRMSELGESKGNGAIRMAGLEGMARSQPKDVETIATIAELHLNEGELTAAAQWIDRGIGVTDDSAQLYLLRGDLLRAREAPEDDVIAAYETALADPNWAAVAQQRIWQIRPPETEEEKLKRAFFGGAKDEDAN